MKTRRHRHIGKKRRNTMKRRSRVRRTAHRGGRLGSIPTGAVFAIQQDPFSAPVFATEESAENIYESRNSYKV